MSGKAQIFGQAGAPAPPPHPERGATAPGEAGAPGPDAERAGKAESPAKLRAAFPSGVRGTASRGAGKTGRPRRGLSRREKRWVS